MNTFRDISYPKLELVAVKLPDCDARIMEVLIQETLSEGMVFEARELLPQDTVITWTRQQDGEIVSRSYQVQQNCPVGPSRWCVQAGLIMVKVDGASNMPAYFPQETPGGSPDDFRSAA